MTWNLSTSHRRKKWLHDTEGDNQFILSEFNINRRDRLRRKPINFKAQHPKYLTVYDIQYYHNAEEWEGSLQDP